MLLHSCVFMLVLPGESFSATVMDAKKEPLTFCVYDWDRLSRVRVHFWVRVCSCVSVKEKGRGKREEERADCAVNVLCPLLVAV